MASILESIGEGSGSLIHLGLSLCYPQERSSRALGLHFGSLVDLDLENCSGVKSTTGRDILCLCLKLEILRAWGVLANDVVQSGPWVCRLLRELKICFWFERSEQDQQQHVFERLSTLDRLESLTMFHPEYDINVEDKDVLEFRLDRGLGHLVSLRHLRTLLFDECSGDGPYMPQLGVDEVEWMATHWRELKDVMGKYNKDSREDAKVRSAFRLRGISTV